MTPVLFINCKREPFVDWIIGGLKQYETRTRNTLKSLLSWALGQRILIAETGHGDPLVRCSAVIDEVVAVYDRDTWNDYLELTWIPCGSDYDWKPDTRVKYLYHLKDIYPVAEPFRLPKSCRRHGRVWAEYDWGIRFANKLTNVSCVYTGGNIYVYQAMYNGHWIYGGLDSWMEAYSYEPFLYQKRTDSSESPEPYRIETSDFPTWQDIIDSLKQDDALIGGDVDECIDIINDCQTLDCPVNI